METSVVRKRINDTIEQARRAAGERRVRTDEGARDYARFLDQTAVPLFRQIAGSLKASNFNFTVFTPSGSVRLMSDKAAEDFVELTLDTAGDRPVVMGRTSRARGRRVIESERPVADVPVADLSDEHLLDFMAVELAPFVER
jgi:hypothetical protein